MHSDFFRSLKFQIISALLLLLLLFAGSITYTFYAIDQHSSDHVILNLASRLQLTAHNLAMQGFNYLESAPRDYTTYYRDVRLYYRDLKGHIGTFDQVTKAFMNGEFPPELTGLMQPVRCRTTCSAFIQARISSSPGTPASIWGSATVPSRTPSDSRTARLRGTFELPGVPVEAPAQEFE